MSIKVETGKKESLSFENSKIKVVSSSGITHSGIINLNSDQPIKTSQPSTRAANSTQTTHTAKPQPKIQTVPINKSKLKILKPGMKLGFADSGFNDLKLMLAAEWDYKSSNFEVDLSFFLTDEEGRAKEEDFIFYNNPVANMNSVVLDTDKKLPIAKQYDICAELDLNKVSSNIHSISVTATILDESRKFGELQNGKLHFITHNNEEFLELSFTDNMTNENAIVLCELYRHKGQWKIKGVAQGFFGGLQALCENFKIETTS